MTYAHPEYLTTAAELAADLDDPKLRIFDASVFLVPDPPGRYRIESGREKFDAGHIPGAVFLDLVDAASAPAAGLNFTLPAVEQLEGLFRELGVDDDSRVVLYSTSHVMWATRAWWLFRYCGHPRVQVLDGGFRAWKAAGGRVSTEPTPHSRGDIPRGDFPRGDFRASPKPALFADSEAVRAAIHDRGTCTVNALSPEVYTGESEMSYGRKGHIPRSVNVFYDELLRDGHFRDAAELERTLAAKGLLSAPRVIAYCGGGISATVDAFACLLVGHENVAVYDGSMAEWCRDESLPLVTGAE